MQYKYFRKNFKAGLKYGAGLYTAITAASICIAPLALTSSFYLLLPAALLISSTVTWIILGVIFTIACGLALSVGKSLFYLMKDSIDKRKISNNGYIKLEALDQEFHDDQQTLVHQTNRENYTYWLRQHDITHIARLIYGYSEESITSGVFFCVPGDVNSLNERLKEYKEKVEKENRDIIFVSIININNSHWVTLIVARNSVNEQFMAYYCDSFGHQLPKEINRKIIDDISLANNISNECITPLNKKVEELIRAKEDGKDTEKKNDIQETLQYSRKAKNKLVSKAIDSDNIMGVLQETMEVNNNNIESSGTKQQRDKYNCGVFALLNAKTIVDTFKDNKSFNEVTQKLSECTLTPERLQEKRKEFTEVLTGDLQWQEGLRGGIFDPDPSNEVNASQTWQCTAWFPCNII
ncbi:MAG: hypothetical protein QWI36_03905 [Wolbachia endosymbiont of Tyrophagus putrescentiae]|nr:hypothetical protein [Wolbachia endosymbiont of Tyrophagus putrescentiae]